LGRHRQPRRLFGAPTVPRQIAAEFRSATGTDEAAGDLLSDLMCHDGQEVFRAGFIEGRTISPESMKVKSDSLRIRNSARLTAQGRRRISAVRPDSRDQKTVTSRDADRTPEIFLSSPSNHPPCGMSFRQATHLAQNKSRIGKINP
jgi:hypothetical protein